MRGEPGSNCNADCRPPFQNITRWSWHIAESSNLKRDQMVRTAAVEQFIANHEIVLPDLNHHADWVGSEAAARYRRRDCASSSQEQELAMSPAAAPSTKDWAFWHARDVRRSSERATNEYAILAVYLGISFVWSRLTAMMWNIGPAVDERRL